MAVPCDAVTGIAGTPRLKNIRMKLPSMSRPTERNKETLFA